jgi:predicted alpha/beta hydrolase
MVVISPATGVKQSFYSAFADFLKQEGFMVITFDFGGIGESKRDNLRRFDTSASDWAKNDLNSVLLFVKENYPELPLNLIGHSIGGQLVGLAPASKYVDKLILVAVQSGYWRFWKGFSKVKMFVYWFMLFPILIRIFGYFPGKRFSSMEDLPKSMALEWSKWGRHPSYLFAYFNEQDLYFNKLKCEIIAYSSSDDFYAPEKSVDWMGYKYTNAKLKRIRLIPQENDLKNIGHFGFFRSKMKMLFWEPVVKDILLQK